MGPLNRYFIKGEYVKMALLEVFAFSKFRQNSVHLIY